MRYLEPRKSGFDSYQSGRHDTLNFESCGGETHSSDDVASRPLAQILQFPIRVAEWITVRINRKENQMTNEHETSTTSTSGGSSPRSSTDGQRVESFTPTGPVWASINTQSGDVVVRASDVNELKVTLSVRSSKNAYLLEHADVTFDTASNVLSIHTLPRGISFSSRGLRVGPKKSWFDFGNSDVDVLVEVPKETSLEVATVSGDTSLHGSLGSVKVKSMSGDVSARDSSKTLDVQTASGDVNSGHVVSLLKCKSASGDVVCSSAAVTTEIYSASGDVELVADQPGKIVVRNVSGDVSVRVARGLAVDVSGDTVSGDMGSNIDLDAKGDGANDDEVIVIKISTVSGDIRIDKAS
ncbi:MAG TPA: DUF4097 family beta strand repeat-containing protein [Acidimicrobiales bacterium]